VRARRSSRRAWLAAAFAGCGAAHADSLPWQVWNSPDVLAWLDANDIVVETSSRCPGGCRYDRSNPGAENAIDNPYPLRWLYADSGEVVLLDENGPGALTRLWLTTGFGTSSCIDPATRIRFYVDGAIMPTLDVALAQLFDGSTPPFTPPLVADRAQSSGGYVSRMPIAYAQSLRVALTNAQGTGNPCSADGRRLLWYQFQHHRVAPGASIASFDETSDEPAWRAFLEHAGDDPWNGLLAPIDTTATLAANASVTLDARNDSGWLRGIRLHLPRAAYGAVSLRVRIDGDVAFDMPLADFFATAADAQRPARGVLVGEDASGWLYAWFPMPFAMSASVELHADASLPSPVAVDASLAFDNAAVPAQAGRFSASLADDCVAAGSFAFDDVRGAGKIVGVAARYHADGVANRGYLEGDERAFVDDASAPAWYGTGIEDFFDGGFYFDHGAFAGRCRRDARRRRRQRCHCCVSTHACRRIAVCGCVANDAGSRFLVGAAGRSMRAPRRLRVSANEAIADRVRRVRDRRCGCGSCARSRRRSRCAMPVIERGVRRRAARRATRSRARARAARSTSAFMSAIGARRCVCGARSTRAWEVRVSSPVPRARASSSTVCSLDRSRQSPRTPYVVGNSRMRR
jgi:hypothetical protein